MSKWRVLRKAHAMIVDRAVEAIGERCPTGLFRGKHLITMRHTGAEKVIVEYGTEVINGMVNDGRLEELLQRMVSFAVEHYGRIGSE